MPRVQKYLNIIIVLLNTTTIPLRTWDFFLNKKIPIILCMVSNSTPFSVCIGTNVHRMAYRLHKPTARHYRWCRVLARMPNSEATTLLITGRSNTRPRNNNFKTSTYFFLSILTAFPDLGSIPNQVFGIGTFRNTFRKVFRIHFQI